MKSNIDFFFPMNCGFDVVFKNSLLRQKKKIFFLFSLRNFIVLHFTLQYTIHFELNFVKEARSFSRFLFSRVFVSCCNTIGNTVFSLLQCQVSWLCSCGCDSVALVFSFEGRMLSCWWWLCCVVSSAPFSSSIVLPTLGLSASRLNLKLSLWYPQSDLLCFWWESCWICSAP